MANGKFYLFSISEMAIQRKISHSFFLLLSLSPLRLVVHSSAQNARILDTVASQSTRVEIDQTLAIIISFHLFRSFFPFKNANHSGLFDGSFFSFCFFFLLKFYLKMLLLLFVSGRLNHFVFFLIAFLLFKQCFLKKRDRNSK